ncbi:putative AT-rich interactive domain-containing protein 4A [Apostichopus japonicus]|uniref:Putative AT-rich interactive domain-containing protein 4A n=1 Tax=Stichopus japonicus TaxID=307972 RepID=A0A2G8LEW2_STIJA|nr:putative AT-rich interactive domain-containing protein 4A [Apostichopus japonicus]
MYNITFTTLSKQAACKPCLEKIQHILTVGTAVSAKYRGAFCEAKVKIINKKLVKCRVTFKDSTSSIIPDEFVKGNLKIGENVEAKQSEDGNWQDGTITKLNDASVYTVLFDDGDEKTLRRSSLCLQGEKHFHESETLDHLPLTDPENFGTPVVRDRAKRKRPHTSRVEDDEESSESEVFRRLRREEPDNAVGKVVLVETNEKRKNLWFPALIVDPSCTKDAPNRTKDHIVTRSFKDNKYYTVPESSWRSFASKDHIYKGDNSSLKSEQRQGGRGSEGTESSDESSDDEYDEQKDAWLASLHKFMEERSTPINKPPVLGYRDLNLYKLYKLVQDLGGWRKVTDKQQWRYIASKMGIPIHNTPQSYKLKQHTTNHNRKLGPGFSSVLTRPRRRSSYERWTPVATPSPAKEEEERTEKKKENQKRRKRLRKNRKLKTNQKQNQYQRKSFVFIVLMFLNILKYILCYVSTHVIPRTLFQTRRKTDVTEQEKEAEEDEEDEDEKKDIQTEEKVTPRTASKRAAAKSVSKEEPELDREEEDLGTDFEVGEKVKVQYGRGRTHKVYEAKIVDVEGSDKTAKYSVHYLGWNVRYDEVVSSERIVASLDKRKEKRLARVKAREKEKEQKQKEKEKERELEQQRKEKERKEKERLEKEAEKARKEKERQEKEEKEKEERERKEREKREKKEREEMDRKLKKEQEERERREKKEREEREKREKREKKEEQQRLEMAAQELLQQEEMKRALEEKSKKAEKKLEEDKGKGKGPAKRGRPPSLSPKTSGRPISPRVSGGGRRSPLYPTRSLRSDRNSLSESPYANGLGAVKHRGRRGSSASRGKAEEPDDSGEESDGDIGIEGTDVSREAPSPAKSDIKPAPEDAEKEETEEAQILEPVLEEVAPPEEPQELESKVDSEMPVFEAKDAKEEIQNQPPKSPPKLKKEGGLDDVVTEDTKEEVEVKKEEVEEEMESKKGKRKSKKSEKEPKQEKEGGKKTSKRRHSKDAKQESVKEDKQEVEVQLEKKEEKEEETEAEKEKEKEKEKVEEAVEQTEEKVEKEDGEGSEEKQATGQEEKKKKGRKRGRKSLEEKNKEKGEKKAKKADTEGGEGSKKGRRRKRRLEENEAEEKDDAKPVVVKEQQPPPVEEEEMKMAEEKDAGEGEPDEMEASTSDSRMMAAIITTPPTTPRALLWGPPHRTKTRDRKMETRRAKVSRPDSVTRVTLIAWPTWPVAAALHQ